MPILRCKRIIFYSKGDELSFFGFAKSITGVRKLSGVADEIHIDVSSRLSNASLRDLLGLFQRYKIGMKQLRQFETSTNSAWLRDERRFWFRKVFKD